MTARTQSQYYVNDFLLTTIQEKHISRPAGFEPTRALPNGYLFKNYSCPHVTFVESCCNSFSFSNANARSLLGQPEVRATSPVAPSSIRPSIARCRHIGTRVALVPPRRRFRKTFWCGERQTKCPTRRAINHRPRRAAAAWFLTGFSVMTKHGHRAVSRPLVARVQTRATSARMRTSPRTCRRHTTTPPAIFFSQSCRRRPVRLLHHAADGHRPGVRRRAQRECRARRG